jgi:transglutaminase-like putative cysteine protease
VHLRIQHTLAYTYSRGVFCEPVTIRLRPRDDLFQRLHDWRCDISPEPAGVSEFRDLDGNLVVKAWFEGLTESLSIASTCDVETLCSDPYRFLLLPEAAVLPVRVEPTEQGLAACYMKQGMISPKVTEIGEEIQRQTGRQTVRFLSALASYLHESFPVVVRPTGEAWAAEKTLAEHTGSCRDLAVLFCEICRSAGLPARFVSGYVADADRNGRHRLHAWSEVYLPGAGWRGFDPTAGGAVSDHHVALAAARIPASASPTSGIFRGTGVTSELNANVRITVAPMEASVPVQSQQPSQVPL